MALCYYHGIQGEKYEAASGSLCFWRVGVRAPLLDGSTVLTNICTDMELHSNQQNVNSVFQPTELDPFENDTALPSMSFLQTLVLFSVCLAWSTGPKQCWKLKLWSSEMLFRKCNALGFLWLINQNTAVMSKWERGNLCCLSPMHIQTYVMLQCVRSSRNVWARVAQSWEVTGLRSDGTKHKHSVILLIHHPTLYSPCGRGQEERQRNSE